MSLPSYSVPAFAISSSDMARRRLQQQGDLYQQGGFWKLRWREDQIDAENNLKRGWSKPAWIGPAQGKQRLTEKEARRLAWENFLSKLDQNNTTPMSVMTFVQFVEKHYRPGALAMLKKSTRKQYDSLLRKHILPSLGDLRLRDISPAEVQSLLGLKLNSVSTKTLKHINNVVSAVFTSAKDLKFSSGENPAFGRTLPEVVGVRPMHAPTVKQLGDLFEALPEPARGVAMMASFTSMNFAEVAGLRWKYVNLTADFVQVDDENIPPFTALIRWQWSHGQYGTVKQKKRKRAVPLDDVLVRYLAGKRTEPESPVFANEIGRPVNRDNLFHRVLKPIGVKLGMPWLGWHSFRRAHSTMADRLAQAMSDRMAMMGHAQAKMTLHYTSADMDRRRGVVGQMTKEVFGQEKSRVQ